MSNAGSATAACKIEAALGAGVTPGDLAELMSTFNEVTSRLQATHVQLQNEVARLQGELRDANEALHRSKRLAALGEMAAGIAHEIRNPLGSIALDADMLREDLADRPEQFKLAERVGESVGRLNAIVGDVLVFARDLRPRIDACCAGDLFDRAMESCRAELNGVATRVAIDRDGSLDQRCVSGDALLLHQALVNVIRNAVEAMEDAPECNAAMRFEAHRDRGGDVLRVIDAGPGVGPEVIERMFNPFFTTRATGTGLGLAIVHRILDAHGGSVRVWNNDGVGATVELRLPSARARDPDAEIQTKTSAGRRLRECA
ncbi:MAG: ATP-binding protein [Planctomycetota bacterium]